MITVSYPLTTGQTFTGAAGLGLITFSDLFLPSRDYVPLVNNIAFTTLSADAWQYVFVHPDGAASGIIMASNDEPDELSPAGYGGFARMGCCITVPTADSLTPTIKSPPRPWQLIFTTGVLTANATLVVSYSMGPRPSGRG